VLRVHDHVEAIRREGVHDRESGGALVHERLGMCLEPGLAQGEGIELVDADTGRPDRPEERMDAKGRSGPIVLRGRCDRSTRAVVHLFIKLFSLLKA
jgi:hypothetical protein